MFSEQNDLFFLSKRMLIYRKRIFFIGFPIVLKYISCRAEELFIYRDY